LISGALYVWVVYLQRKFFGRFITLLTLECIGGFDFVNKTSSSMPYPCIEHLANWFLLLFKFWFSWGIESVLVHCSSLFLRVSLLSLKIGGVVLLMLIQPYLAHAPIEHLAKHFFFFFDSWTFCPQDNRVNNMLQAETAAT